MNFENLRLSLFQNSQIDDPRGWNLDYGLLSFL